MPVADSVTYPFTPDCQRVTVQSPFVTEKGRVMRRKISAAAIALAALLGAGAATAATASAATQPPVPYTWYHM